jgi:hypothetical protein
MFTTISYVPYVPKSKYDYVIGFIHGFCIGFIPISIYQIFLFITKK